jgi:hypothetical protein
VGICGDATTYGKTEHKSDIAGFFERRKEKKNRIRQRRGRGITLFDRGSRKNKRWLSLSLSKP